MEILATIVLGPIMSSIMEYAKSKGLSSKLVVALIVLIAGAGYAIFDYYAPADLKNHIVILASSTATRGILFYELIIKQFNAQK